MSALSVEWTLNGIKNYPPEIWGTLITITSMMDYSREHKLPCKLLRSREPLLGVDARVVYKKVDRAIKPRRMTNVQKVKARTSRLKHL